MRAELILFGKPIDLSRQHRRRILVVCVYAALLLALASLAWFASTPSNLLVGSTYVFFFTLGINYVLLGGYARSGLIRAFANTPPPETARTPFIPLALRVRPIEIVDTEWRNDERELQVRDRAHYSAYQVVSITLVFIWLLNSWTISPLRFVKWWPQTIVHDTASLLALVGVLLSITLPQAIILWREPDMAELPLDDEN
ncbi:hypothetical protein ACFPT7_09230 [Acidicapsa dinghuensis]|uniref:Uncharacterized protein n=1 Tax=Acidicapsa dinghuensis TaxID=2218256 RepID=A0ABW1EER6_9BACT|nr:hypothetical protein [Acidicapsa dinghuensis]